MGVRFGNAGSEVALLEGFLIDVHCGSLDVHRSVTAYHDFRVVHLTFQHGGKGSRFVFVQVTMVQSICGVVNVKVLSDIYHWVTGSMR